MYILLIQCNIESGMILASESRLNSLYKDIPMDHNIYIGKACICQSSEDLCL